MLNVKWIMAGLLGISIGGLSVYAYNIGEDGVYFVDPVPAEILAKMTDPSYLSKLPNMQTVVIDELNVVNQGKEEIIRFSNGIANTGGDDLRMHHVGGGITFQEILNPDGSIADSVQRGQMLFHPDHNHFHMNAVALFVLRRGSLSGEVLPGQKLKTTFCLIDWYKLNDNSPTREREYFDCNAEYQGIQPGWVDQYHQSTTGQEVKITGQPAGIYYLVSVANPDGVFIEQNYNDNVAWTKFYWSRDSKGNGKARILETSSCAVSVCPAKNIPNR